MPLVVLSGCVLYGSNSHTSIMEVEDPVAFLRVSDKLARLEESKSFESKKWIWIQDKKECFKAAEVKSSKGDIYVVETNDGQVYLYLHIFYSALKFPFYVFYHYADQTNRNLAGF